MFKKILIIASVNQIEVSKGPLPPDKSNLTDNPNPGKILYLKTHTRKTLNNLS